MFSASCLGRTMVCVLSCWAMLLGPDVRAEEPFDYFRNSWNVIGLKDYASGTRVTPENELLLASGARARIRFGLKETPLSRQQTKTALEGWMPVMLLSAAEGTVRYEFTLWATPLPSVKDWRAAFDWPTEDENFLNWVRVKATNTGSAQADARVKVEQWGKDRSGSDSLSWSLAPGASATDAIRIPFAPVADAARFARQDSQLWLDRTTGYWRDVMSRAARIEVPCRKATDALLAAHVCQLIANDHGELRGGEGFYDQFYIRDGAYQLMELEEAGMDDVACKAVDAYLARQRPDGRFETQKNQWDANGQALWVLWQYVKITGDRAWLEKAYPPMRRAVDWARQARRQSPADSPFAGLLPAAPADGESLWDGKHHIVGYDLWNLRGLLCTADAARLLGKSDEAAELDREAHSYRAAVDAAWKRLGLAHFPPSWENDGTHWGNTETLWPTELFPVDDPRVTATIDHARHQHGGGFIEGTIQWLGRPAIHPYMSAYTTMASLVQGRDEQVAEDFYWYLLHSTAAHAFPEGIFQKRRFAWSNTIPHVTGASNYALMLRHMLVHERDDELHLLASVPDWWLEPGREIHVQRAPTHFGPLDLDVRGAAAGVEVRLKGPTRELPQRIVLHLPKSRPLIGRLEKVEIVLRPDQTQRWDFPTVVRRYEKDAPPLMPPPVAGLVSLPLVPALGQTQCRMLDLARLANTDPLTAPFGVSQPGKFVFADLPLGVQTVGGVPFRILDPAVNQGRGLVVLHSPKAPANRSWPREVTIAVGAAGSRLFFLGAVHGWSSGDPAVTAGEPVAEYVIEYADGQKQVVPLIPGRTSDEWASPPQAEDAFVGLRGTPWHLNVLGVELRAPVVEKIVFRDLDTPAAPVLAAVTLQQ